MVGVGIGVVGVLVIGLVGFGGVGVGGVACQRQLVPWQGQPQFRVPRHLQTSITSLLNFPNQRNVSCLFETSKNKDPKKPGYISALFKSKSGKSKEKRTRSWTNFSFGKREKGTSANKQPNLKFEQTEQDFQPEPHLEKDTNENDFGISSDFFLRFLASFLRLGR